MSAQWLPRVFRLLRELSETPDSVYVGRFREAAERLLAERLLAESRQPPAASHQPDPAGSWELTVGARSRYPKALVAKEIQNLLAYPYAWQKVGLGDLPVDKVAGYCRDRAAHVAELAYGFEVSEAVQALCRQAHRAVKVVVNYEGEDSAAPLAAALAAVEGEEHEV